MIIRCFEAIFLKYEFEVYNEGVTAKFIKRNWYTHT